MKHYDLDERGFQGSQWIDSSASDTCDESRDSSSETSGIAQPAENLADVKRESLVQMQLMKMRRPGPDHRGILTVAEAVLKLLEVRAATFTDFNNPFLAESGREMTDDEIKAT